MSGVAGYPSTHQDGTSEWAVRIPTWTDLGGNFTDYQGRRPDGEVGFNGFYEGLNGLPDFETEKAWLTFWSIFIQYRFSWSKWW